MAFNMYINLMILLSAKYQVLNFINFWSSQKLHYYKKTFTEKAIFIGKILV